MAETKALAPQRDLTGRELEVLALVAKAFTNGAIADNLFIQSRTVEHHINSIYSKLSLPTHTGQHRRVQAALQYNQVEGATLGERAALRSPSREHSGGLGAWLEEAKRPQ